MAPPQPPCYASLCETNCKTTRLGMEIRQRQFEFSLVGIGIGGGYL